MLTVSIAVAPIQPTTMDLVMLAVVAVLGVAAVLFLFRRQSKDYGKQLNQLQPKKKRAQKREFGVYTLEVRGVGRARLGVAVTCGACTVEAA